jgi:pSer/pThr/pTyr-binding forkhead associated (FHA) protein
MPSISIIHKNQIVANHQISKGDTLLIGRNKVNDIVIDSPLVSNQHAKIDSDGNGYLYVDLQSSNGSFKDGRPIKSHWLNDGDTIAIGNYMLKFLNPKVIKQPQKTPTVINKTMKIDPKRIQEILKTNKRKDNLNVNAKKKSTPKRKKPVAVLFYLSGDKTRLQLNGNLIKIGKDPKSEVPVKGFGIGKTAAIINKLSDGWYISSVGGFFKPRLNNVLLEKTIKLNTFDIITIGATKLQFLLRYK